MAPRPRPALTQSKRRRKLGKPSSPRTKSAKRRRWARLHNPKGHTPAKLSRLKLARAARFESGQAPRMGQGQSSNETAARPGGNAVATGNIQISSATASQIADALMSTGRSQNISVAVNIGAPLPGNVDLLPLPPAVVALVPEYQGYEYVVVNDEIVIIQPSTRGVAEIIRPGGVAEAPVGPPPVSVNLTDAQRQLLLDSVRDERLPEAQIAGLTAGETAPRRRATGAGAQRGGRSGSDDRTLSPVRGEERSGRSCRSKHARRRRRRALVDGS